MAVLCTAKGKARITENIFEARNKHISELVKMGADINMEDGMHFVVNGVDKLKGAVVDAKDLRGGAALVIAALAAEGRSVVNNSGFVERGYEGIEEKLSLLGGEVKII
jgi:UDP-N-acetylglucosamine 1-carboxyvinyltransferase